MEERTRETLKEIFKKSKNILVIYPENANFDKLAFTTALFEGLKNYNPSDRAVSEDDFFPKNVSLLSTKNLASEFNKIDLLNETKTEVGNKNLCVSFDYVPESVEKVSYYIDEDSKKFYLTIQPKVGVPPLDKNKIEYFYTGADAEMVFLVGIDTLEDLKQLYFGYENLYQNAALVSINNYETDFGHFIFDISSSSCYSEFLLGFLNNFLSEQSKSSSSSPDISGNDVEDDNKIISGDSATHLLAAISEQTNNFESYLATADTFEVVSKLLRLGARRSLPKRKELFSSADFSFDRSKSLESSSDENYDSEEDSEAFENGQVVEESEQESEVEADYSNKLVIAENMSDFASVLAKKSKISNKNIAIKTKAKKKNTDKVETSINDIENSNLSAISSKVKNSSKTKPKNKNKDAVGSLNYNPSGFGPKGG